MLILQIIRHMNGYSTLGLVILIFDVIAIIEIVRGPKDMTHKLLWCLLILCAPIVGLLLYYILGRGAMRKN